MREAFGGAVGDELDDADGDNGATFCAGELSAHGRLFARNLPFGATEEELEALFGAHGTVSELHVPLDSETRRGKGFAHVTYEEGEDAVTALAKLDGTIF